MAYEQNWHLLQLSLFLRSDQAPQPVSLLTI
jgi:hypothetical protein